MPRISIPAIGSIGINLDQPAHELPPSALTSVTNIRLRDGCAARIAGDTAVFTTPTQAPYWIGLMTNTTDRLTVYAGLTAAFADNNSAQTDITGTAFTGGVDDRWTGGAFNGILILNNGIDKPMYWNGDLATNLATLTGWNATWKCKAMRPFREYLIGLNWTKNTSYYPHMVKWSAAAEPGAVPATWDEADATNDAGEFDLSETPGVLVDGLTLGDSFVCYKSDSMYALTYVGGQYIFNARKLPGELGLFARGCVCNTPSGHLVLTIGDLVIHSGMGPQSILTGRLRNWLFDQIDPTYGERSFLVSNPALNEAWLCFPEVGQSVCTKALIWNWAENTFSLRALANVTCGTSGQYEYSSNASWASDSDAWSADGTTWNASDIAATQSRFLLGTTAPLLLGVDIGTDFNGTTFTGQVERTGLTFGDADKVKTVRAVFPRIDGTTGSTVYIQVGGAMDPEGSYTWSSAVPYVIGSTYRADLFMSGRFLAYRIYSTAAFDWRVKSIDFDLVAQGSY